MIGVLECWNTGRKKEWWVVEYWERVKDRKLSVVFVFIQHSDNPILHYSE